MSKLISTVRMVVFVVGALFLASCNDFLNDIPKGQKTPKTWSDYNAFIKNKMFSYYELNQVFCLMDDLFKTPSALNSDRLLHAHYYWNENEDRKLVNSSDKNAYFSAYEALFYWNMIIEFASSATECSTQQRSMLVSQAKVLRAMTYFYLTNYYAAPYSEKNRTLLAVPLVKSSLVDAPSPQVTLEEMYRFILSDLHDALKALPKEGETILHPTHAAGLGMLARVYLSMGNYEEALKYASLALEENHQLYDWIKFYNDDKDRFTDPENYSASCKSDPEKDNVENYVFHFSSSGFWSGMKGTAYAISVDRAKKFETGDTRLLTHWKTKTSSTSGLTIFAGIYGIEPNKGGIRTPEMYYIKAECLARKGGEANLKEAMKLVNEVRKTRILPEHYHEWTASNTREAVQKIIADKANEYIQSQVIFCDYRRLNLDSEYAVTLKKNVDGKEYRLNPNSHLWIMPFPIEAVNNPGNGTITQNVNK